MLLFGNTFTEMLANMGRADIAPFGKSRYILKAFGIKETSREAGYEVFEADVNDLCLPLERWRSTPCYCLPCLRGKRRKPPSST